MSRFELTTRPHPARGARRALGLASITTTIGIAGAIAASQGTSSADEMAASDTPSTTVLTTTDASTPVLPTTTATPGPVPTPSSTTTAPLDGAATSTTFTGPADNPFAEHGALSDLTDLVVTTTTTSVAPVPANTPPRVSQPPATNPPTTVSDGS